MGISTRPHHLLSALFISGLLGHPIGHSALAQSVALRPSLEEDIIDTKIGGRNTISIGIYADSNILLNSPYSLTSSAGLGKFSYQVPVGIGIDLAWGLSGRWELGASVGYQKYEAREVGGNTDENFTIAGYTSIPVRMLIRYRWPEKVVAPEFEIAGGVNFQHNTVRSSIESAQELESTRLSPYMHAGGGISYAWGDDLTIHFIGGYAAMMNGNKTFQSGTDYNTKTNSLVHGVFTKGMVRVQF